MNRLFGFFKQKLIEAKQQNQNQLQNLVGALEGEPYSKAKMLSYLQQIKTNYLEWNILIANEASTGLYFSQIHNKTCVVKKSRAQRQTNQRISKNEISVEQMQKTLKELRDIDKLNREWVNVMNSRVERLQNSLLKNKDQNSNQISKKGVFQQFQKMTIENEVYVPNEVNQQIHQPVLADKEEQEEQNSDKNAESSNFEKKLQQKKQQLDKNQQ